MATYIITFVPEGSQGLQPFLRRLAQSDPRITVVDGGLMIDPSSGAIAGFDILPGEEWMVRSRGEIDDEALFILFKAYFAISNTDEPGLLVATEADGQARLIAIAPGEDETSSSDPLTVVVEPAALLSDVAVFRSAWPNLIAGETDDPPLSEGDGETVRLSGTEGLAFGHLFLAPDLERDAVSFLVFGATPEQVMTEMLRPESYVREDDGYLVVELEDIDQRIEVVSFDTDRGPVSELRIPLAVDQVDAAIKQLAPTAPAEAGFGHVLDADDASESFSVQMIDRSGFGSEIVTVRLLF